MTFTDKASIIFNKKASNTYFSQPNTFHDLMLQEVPALPNTKFPTARLPFDVSHFSHVSYSIEHSLKERAASQAQSTCANLCSRRAYSGTTKVMAVAHLP